MRLSAVDRVRTGIPLDVDQMGKVWTDSPSRLRDRVYCTAACPLKILDIVHGLRMSFTEILALALVLSQQSTFPKQVYEPVASRQPSYRFFKTSDKPSF